MNNPVAAVPLVQLKAPYLIQRCTIYRPLGEFSKGKFGDSLDVDYMGSSYFEGNEKSLSLRYLQAHSSRIKIDLHPTLYDGDDRALRVLHTFDEEQWVIYQAYLTRLRGFGDPIHLEEWTGFDKNYRPGRLTTFDFWWDIENHVMFSFDKKYMNRVVKLLERSWKHMDERKAQREQSISR